MPIRVVFSILLALSLTSVCLAQSPVAGYSGPAKGRFLINHLQASGQIAPDPAVAAQAKKVGRFQFQINFNERKEVNLLYAAFAAKPSGIEDLGRWLEHMSQGTGDPSRKPGTLPGTLNESMIRLASTTDGFFDLKRLPFAIEEREKITQALRGSIEIRLNPTVCRHCKLEDYKTFDPIRMKLDCKVKAGWFSRSVEVVSTDGNQNEIVLTSAHSPVRAEFAFAPETSEILRQLECEYQMKFRDPDSRFDFRCELVPADLISKARYFEAFSPETQVFESSLSFVDPHASSREPIELASAKPTVTVNRPEQMATRWFSTEYIATGVVTDPQEAVNYLYRWIQMLPEEARRQWDNPRRK